MPEQHLYEYAVIRVLPAVEREEFFNAGIILFSKKARFIAVHIAIDEAKLCLFSKELDAQLLRDNLISFEKIALGLKEGGPIAAMELAERFRWLTAVRSSCLQTSRPHPGLCQDLEKTARRLFEELVL